MKTTKNNNIKIQEITSSFVWKEWTNTSPSTGQYVIVLCEDGTIVGGQRTSNGWNVMGSIISEKSLRAAKWIEIPNFK